MGNTFTTIWRGAKASLKGNRYKALFVLSALIIFSLFAAIPIWAVPGNTLVTQFSILTVQDFLLLAFLSLLYALFITMQIYAMRMSKKMKGVGTAVGGGAAGALVAGIAGTAFCASCLAPLFALVGIGFGGVLFVLEYRLYFVLGITVLMLLAIYFVAKRITKTCDTC